MSFIFKWPKFSIEDQISGLFGMVTIVTDAIISKF